MTWKTHSKGITTSSIITLPLVANDIARFGFDVARSTLLFIILSVLVHQSARMGTIFPDLDHHSGSIPQKSVLTLLINKLLHFLFRGRNRLSHRSWQTHSVDLYVLFTGIPSYYLYVHSITQGDIVDYMLAVMLFTFCISACIHCLMDMFTTKGVWLSIILAYILSIGKKKGHYKRYRLKLAPTWFWYPVIRFRNSRNKKTLLPRIYKYTPIKNANTGGEYEEGFRHIFQLFNYLFLATTLYIYLQSVLLPSLA